MFGFELIWIYYLRILSCFTVKYNRYPIIVINNWDTNVNEVIIVIDSPVTLKPTNANHNEVIITNNNGPTKFNLDLNCLMKNNPKKVKTGE